MNAVSVLFAMIKADFLERTRRSSFLVTLCLVIYLGYAVNSGQILIQLGGYRGIYNSAWVGSLMALVITFCLGLIGFFLVKNTVERDERTGVGQIIATTPLNRVQYLFGKWLSNLAVLSLLVVILAVGALLMQLLYGEDSQLQLWALIAPFLFIAVPTMALVAALAVLFETVSWLKGGFGNLAYFFLFTFLVIAGVQLPAWLDVIGFNLVGSSMKDAARSAFADYNGNFVLSMISKASLDTFVWPGLNWTLELILQRLMWLVVSVGIVLLGVPLFNRFDPTRRSASGSKLKSSPTEISLPEDSSSPALDSTTSHLTPLGGASQFHLNLLRLTWLECVLLVKGLKWYWVLGMGGIWLVCAAAPTESLRQLGFMLAGIWPVLVWSKLGEREVRYQAQQLIYQAAHPLARQLAASWLAGVLVTAIATGGVLLGRLIYAEPLALLPWVLSVLFIPTLALTLGIWSGTSKVFEVVYPIWWYLGPFNPQSSLAIIDFLGIHPTAFINTAPHWAVVFVLLLILLAVVGRRRQMTF